MHDNVSDDPDSHLPKHTQPDKTRGRATSQHRSTGRNRHHIAYLAVIVLASCMHGQTFADIGATPVNHSSPPFSVTLPSVFGTAISYRMAYGRDFTLDQEACTATSCVITFAPRFPGLRRDAIVGIDNGGHIVGAEPVYGIGEGPLPTFSPGTISTAFKGQHDGATFGIASDAAGNIYVSDYLSNTVTKVDTLGNAKTVAGTGTPGFSGDGGIATSAELQHPGGLAIDGANLYIADVANNRIRKVDANGVITTLAGNGCYGYSGDGSSSSAASLAFPYSVATDAFGNVYIADSGNNVVRKVDTNGLISTVAGVQGKIAAAGDNGLAIRAYIGIPGALTVASDGTLYISDEANFFIRKVTSDGVISTVAGIGAFGDSGDGEAAVQAAISHVYGLAVDPAGNVYVSDSDNGYIRKIDTHGIIGIMAGIGAGVSPSGDGGPATSAAFDYPAGINIGDDGSVYFASGGDIRKIDAKASLVFPTGAVNTLVGVQSLKLINIGNAGQTLDPLAISGDFSIDDSSTCTPSLLLDTSPTGCTIAVSFSPTEPGVRTGTIIVGSHLSAALSGTAVPAPVPPVSSLGTAPVGGSGTTTDVPIPDVGGPAASYKMAFGLNFSLDQRTCSGGTCQVLFAPHYPGRQTDALLAIDSTGNVMGTRLLTAVGKGALVTRTPGIISSIELGGKRMITASALDPVGNLYFFDGTSQQVGKLETNGVMSASPIEGLASANGIAVDGAGNLYIVNADGLFKASPEGSLSRFAPGTKLYSPAGIAIGSNGTVYIADNGTQTSRIVEIGADESASVLPISVSLTNIQSIAVDKDDNLYLATGRGGALVKVTPSGTATTLALSMPISDVSAVQLDAAGNLYVVDAFDNQVFRVAPNGVCTLVAGDGSDTDSGDGGSSTGAGLQAPQMIHVLPDGTLFVMGRGAIRKIIGAPASLAFPRTESGKVAPRQTVNFLNIGNLAFAFASDFIFDENPSQFGWVPETASDCSVLPSFLLAPAAMCSIGIEFMPTVNAPAIDRLTVAPSLSILLSGNSRMAHGTTISKRAK